ncbi:MAG: HAD-IIB family hydrolase [Patescibacteria group bacterium]
MVSIVEKKLIVFDLDGTLAESKAIMDSEMSGLLVRLLRQRLIAVIGGGAFYKFEEQFIHSFQCPDELKSRLLLFPTCAARSYRFEAGAWKELYADMIPEPDRQRIRHAFDSVFMEVGYSHPEKTYGEIIEDRGTQVTFSALGQQAPVAEKKLWRVTKDWRPLIQAALMARLPEFEVRLGGETSIDVTKKGVDKAYGIKQIEQQTGTAIKEMVFIGDALFEGGNDYPVKAIGVDCLAVAGPSDTKQILREWLFILESTT